MTRIRKIAIGVIITSMMLLLQVIAVPIIRQLDNRFLDLKFRLRGPIEPRSPLVLVCIDQKSIKEVGKWPWPREKIASLVKEISSRGPKAVGLDFVFSEPSYTPGSDAALATAIGEAGGVVLGAIFYFSPIEGTFQSQTGFEANLKRLEKSKVNIVRSLDKSDRRLRLITAYGALASIPSIGGGAAYEGFYNVLPESDGAIRYGPLLVQAAGKVYHSMPVSLARLWHGARNIELITESCYVMKIILHGPGGEAWEIPTDRLGRIYINYYGEGSQFPSCRASDLMAGKVEPGFLRDKIVLVGGTSLGDFDMAETPFTPAMPSIHVQATILDNVLGNNALLSGYPAQLINRLAILFLGLLMSFLLPRLRRVSSGIALFCGLLAATVLADYYLFIRYRLVIESIYPFATIICSYVFITIYGYATLTKEIHRFDRALSGVGATVTTRLDIEQFLPLVLHSVVEHLNADRGLLALSKEGPADSLEKIRYEAFFAFCNLDSETVFSDGFGYERRVIDETLSSDKPRVIEKSWKATRPRGRAADHAIGSVICMPIIMQGRTLGFLYIDTERGGHALSQNELKIMVALIPALRTAIENALLYSELKKEKELLRGEVVYLKKEIEKDARFKDLIGESPAILSVFNLIEKAAASPIGVLIGGETGTGKELAARAIHYISDRRENLLVTQSCAALPDQLLESELFGHKKGAFTGAVADKKGLFEIADGGTMFLDEIGDAPAPVQVKLLRVLQDGVIRPLGGLTEKKVDVRIISATNKKLEEEVRKGTFREDLFYRLNAFQIILPPLRERREDIPLIASHFLEKYSRELQRNVKGISADAMALLRAYDYPGNVRELENEVQRVVAMTPDGSIIEAQFLSEKLTGPRGISDGDPEPFTAGRTLKETVEILERQLVLKALRRHKFNRTAAAADLGVSRTGLRLIMKRLKIDEEA